ncbi:MAG: hypothetical protein LLF76_09815, partial [Planctomycetaceae bacterium]|nr:hypothetical protein [Planctomycetaceae bacterium]
TALPESFYGVFNPFAVALHNIIPFKNEYLKTVISYPQVWRHFFLLHPGNTGILPVLLIKNRHKPAMFNALK